MSKSYWNIQPLCEFCEKREADQFVLLEDNKRAYWRFSCKCVFDDIPLFTVGTVVKAHIPFDDMFSSPGDFVAELATIARRKPRLWGWREWWKMMKRFDNAVNGEGI